MFIFDPPHLIIMSIPYDNTLRMLNVGTVTYMHISDVQRLGPFMKCSIVSESFGIK